MRCNPMCDEVWAQITEGRPMKVGDNIYFSKVRKANKNKVAVYITQMAVSEQGIKVGLVYRVRMKGITTGEVYMTSLTFKPNFSHEDNDRWPMYAVIPDMESMPESGSKLYLRLEPFDAVDWFESSRKESMDYFNLF